MTINYRIYIKENKNTIPANGDGIEMPEPPGNEAQIRLTTLDSDKKYGFMILHFQI